MNKKQIVVKLKELEAAMTKGGMVRKQCFECGKPFYAASYSRIFCPACLLRARMRNIRKYMFKKR